MMMTPPAAITIPMIATNSGSGVDCPMYITAMPITDTGKLACDSDLS